MSVRVIGDRVLVALPPEPDEIQTDSGLVLMRDPDVIRTPTQGIVMAVGEKIGTVEVDDVVDLIMAAPFRNGPYVSPSTLLADVKALKPAAFDVQVGDCVIFPRGAGDQIEDAGVEYVILHEHEIIAVVEPLKSEAA